MVKVEDVVAGVSLFIVTAELRHPHASSSPHIAYIGYGLVGLRIIRQRQGTILSTAVTDGYLGVFVPGPRPFLYCFYSCTQVVNIRYYSLYHRVPRVWNRRRPTPLQLPSTAALRRLAHSVQIVTVLPCRLFVSAQSSSWIRYLIPHLYRCQRIKI